MKALATILLAFGTVFADGMLIQDGDFQMSPPTPWMAIQPSGAHTDVHYPSDSAGDYCGLTDVSARGSGSTLESRLRQRDFRLTLMPIEYTDAILWEVWYMPGASQEIASFAFMVIAWPPGGNQGDTLLYQYGKAGLEQPRPHFGVVNMDTAPAGEWQRVRHYSLKDDWYAAGLDTNAALREVVLYSRGLDQQGTWFGQKVRWDNVDIWYGLPSVSEPLPHPTRPSALRVWPTVSRGPVHYESSSPVFLYDATGRQLAVFPSGRGRIATPSHGVFFLKSGGETVRVTNL